MAGPSRIKLILRLAVAVAVAGVVVYLFVFSRHGYLRLRALEHENDRLETRISQIETENEELRDEIDRMENDLEVIERLARTDLGLIKDGDKVYRFVEGDEEE
jgi:cell division protein FtsB